MYLDDRPQGEIAAPVVDEVGRALLRAADLIERGGHCKGEFWDDAGRHCAIGAIAKLAEDSLYSRTIKRLKRAAGAHDIPSWNDAPERTQAEVVAALRKAAVTP